MDQQNEIGDLIWMAETLKTLSYLRAQVHPLEHVPVETAAERFGVLLTAKPGLFSENPSSSGHKK